MGGAVSKKPGLYGSAPRPARQRSSSEIREFALSITGKKLACLLKIRLVHEDLGRTATSKPDRPRSGRVGLPVAALDPVRSQHPAEDLRLHLVVNYRQCDCAHRPKNRSALANSRFASLLRGLGRLELDQPRSQLRDRLVLLLDDLAKPCDLRPRVLVRDATTAAVVALLARGPQVLLGPEQLRVRTGRVDVVTGGGGVRAAWPLDLTQPLVSLEDVAAEFLPASGRVGAAGAQRTERIEPRTGVLWRSGPNGPCCSASNSNSIGLRLLIDRPTSERSFLSSGSRRRSAIRRAPLRWSRARPSSGWVERQESGHLNLFRSERTSPAIQDTGRAEGFAGDNVRLMPSSRAEGTTKERCLEPWTTFGPYVPDQ